MCLPRFGGPSDAPIVWLRDGIAVFFWTLASIARPAEFHFKQKRGFTKGKMASTISFTIATVDHCHRRPLISLTIASVYYCYR